MLNSRLILVEVFRYVLFWRKAGSALEIAAEETLCGKVEVGTYVLNLTAFFTHHFDGQSYNIVGNPFAGVLAAVGLGDSRKVFGRYVELVCIELHFALASGIDVEHVDKLTIDGLLTRNSLSLNLGVDAEGVE